MCCNYFFMNNSVQAKLTASWLQLLTKFQWCRSSTLTLGKKVIFWGILPQMIFFKSWFLYCVCACQSSLLSAILGELSQESGVVKVKGELTYTSQQPWILPGTIRSNILFGKALNPKKYDRVLRACALKRVRNVLDNHMPRCIVTLCTVGIRNVLACLACEWLVRVAFGSCSGHGPDAGRWPGDGRGQRSQPQWRPEGKGQLSKVCWITLRQCIFSPLVSVSDLTSICVYF